MNFLAATSDASDPHACIQGAPWDEGTSYRKGAAAAPSAIRAASDSIETYSPITGKDLEDLRLRDLGDIDLSGCDAAKAMELIEHATFAAAQLGGLVVTIGGDHSVSIGTSAGLRRKWPDLAHLVFDAHMDLRPEYDGSPLSHACGTRHMSSAGPTAVVGVRSGSRTEYLEAPELLTAFSSEIAVPPEFLAEAVNKPVFVSLDMDVLDPSILPGTGTPEPGGPTYVELRETLLGLCDLQIVGFDVVEVAPPLEPSGLSEVVAAALIRDCVLAWRG